MGLLDSGPPEVEVEVEADNLPGVDTEVELMAVVELGNLPVGRLEVGVGVECEVVSPAVDAPGTLPEVEVEVEVEVGVEF